jgi:hypothetical protein
MTTSPRYKNYKNVVADTSLGFGRVFSEKLAELFGLEDEMSMIDRSRLEEMRDFMFDVFCRSFFQLSGSNLPRVFALTSAITDVADENGCITEDRLNEISPPECKQILDRSSIIAKSIVDTGFALVKVNPGIRSFATLGERFSLRSGFKLELLRKTADSIR